MCGDSKGGREEEINLTIQHPGYTNLRDVNVISGSPNKDLKANGFGPHTTG